jgi:uncharacterized protein (DUF362 family)
LKVFVSSIDKNSLNDTVLQALEWIEWEKLIKPEHKIFIKPNLTYPFYKPGVTTSPEMIEALISVLKTRCKNITIGESDGGSRGWKAEEAFEGHNLYNIAKKNDIQLVNLGKMPSEFFESVVDGKIIKIHLPSFLIHDTDVFITMPVPKVHVMTGVSLGFKNQWGCIPDTMRLKYHYQFSQQIVGIHKLLKTKIAIFDGTYFLDRTGPMAGDAIPMNLIIASDDIGAGSLACCRIMNIDHGKVKHFRVAKKEGMFPSSIDEIEFNDKIEKYSSRKFYLNRSILNYMAIAAFNSKFGTYLVYRSPLAGPIHKLLYAIRGKPKDYKGY